MPGVRQVVKLHDAVCMKCGTELEFPDVAIVAEAGMRRAHPDRTPAGTAY